jgi:hypothetical protein
VQPAVPEASPPLLPPAPSTPPGSKRPSSVLVSSPSLKQSEAVFKQKALVSQLKIASIKMGLTADEALARKSELVFAERELYNLTNGEYVLEGEEESKKGAKKQKVVKEGGKEGAEVTRCGNTGSLSALELALGINSNEALDDGKKLSKKNQRIADAEEEAAAAGAGGDEDVEEE